MVSLFNRYASCGVSFSSATTLNNGEPFRDSNGSKLYLSPMIYPPELAVISIPEFITLAYSYLPVVGLS